MSKRKKPRGNWSWNAQEASQASFTREVESRRVQPYATLQEALSFAENLLAVAVKGIEDAENGVKLAALINDDFGADFHASDRTYWAGIRAACIAITNGTTIPR